MKKLVIILSIVAMASGAFAQGKVGFSNDSARLITWTTDTGSLRAGELAKSGLAVTSTDVQLKAQLYYNTSGGSGVPAAEGALVAFSTPTTLAFAITGTLPGTSMALSAPVAVAGGQYGTFQIRVWEASFVDYASALAAPQAYTGKSPVFTSLTGAFAPNPLYAQVSPSFSTWAPGAIFVSAIIPEPSTLALAGLGAAAMLIFRRRK